MATPSQAATGRGVESASKKAPLPLVASQPPPALARGPQYAPAAAARSLELCRCKCRKILHEAPGSRNLPLLLWKAAGQCTGRRGRAGHSANRAAARASGAARATSGDGTGRRGQLCAGLGWGWPCQEAVLGAWKGPPPRRWRRHHPSDPEKQASQVAVRRPGGGRPSTLCWIPASCPGRPWRLPTLPSWGCRASPPQPPSGCPVSTAAPRAGGTGPMPPVGVLLNLPCTTPQEPCKPAPMPWARPVVVQAPWYLEVAMAAGGRARQAVGERPISPCDPSYLSGRVLWRHLTMPPWADWQVVVAWKSCHHPYCCCRSQACSRRAGELLARMAGN